MKLDFFDLKVGINGALVECFIQQIKVEAEELRDNRKQDFFDFIRLKWESGEFGM